MSTGSRWVLAAAGLLLVAISGLWLLASRPLHPDPRQIPSVTNLAPSSKWFSAVEQAQQIVRAGISEQNLPGVSVAVGIDNEIVWAEGFGYADLANRVPVKPAHRFRIGTASIALTSAAAGLLLEEGRLKLDNAIQTWVPEFPAKPQPVTLRQLMGHTAGITPGNADEAALLATHCERPVEALTFFAGAPLLFSPGTGYRYSSFDWVVVSAAVETAAARPYLKFMQERIFNPLGMRDTVPDSRPGNIGDDDDFPLFNLIREKVFDPLTTQRAATKTAQDGVTSYYPRLGTNPKNGMHLMRPLDYSCYAGAGVFRSTPSDLVRLAMAIDSGKLLQPATVKLLQTSQRLPSGEETGYGLGWDLKTVKLAGKPTRVIGHDGESLGGMVASLMTFPEYGITVSVTSNISYARTFPLGVQIAEAFAAHEQTPARR